MTQFVKQLGEKLISQHGDVDTATALSGKQAVALWFSTSWCNQSKKFAPILEEKYNELKALGHGFEIISVSKHKTEGKFRELYGERPWLAQPFNCAQVDTIPDTYSVEDFPLLVILNGLTAEVVIRNGLKTVLESSIADFPYREMRLSEHENWLKFLFGECIENTVKLVNSIFLLEKKLVNTTETLAGLDYLMIQICGKSSNSCQEFVPKFAEKYRKLKELGEKFEVIFVSTNLEVEQYYYYYAMMPWMGLPYDKRELAVKLDKRYNKTSKDLQLTVIDVRNTGETIWSDAESGIESEDFIKNFTSKVFGKEILNAKKMSEKDQKNIIVGEGDEKLFSSNKHFEYYYRYGRRNGGKHKVKENQYRLWFKTNGDFEYKSEVYTGSNSDYDEVYKEVYTGNYHVEQKGEKVFLHVKVTSTYSDFDGEENCYRGRGNEVKKREDQNIKCKFEYLSDTQSVEVIEKGGQEIPNDVSKCTLKEC